MSTTKINARNPKTKKRECMALDNDTKRAKNSSGKSWALGYLEKTDKNGVGFFETYENGKLIQKKGRFSK